MAVTWSPVALSSRERAGLSARVRDERAVRTAGAVWEINFYRCVFNRDRILICDV